MNYSEYFAKVAELKEDLKRSETEYVPSGETPLTSLVLLILMSLLVAGMCYAIARPICLLFYEIVGAALREGGGTALEPWQEVAAKLSAGRWIALGILIVNVIIFVVITFTTMFSFKVAARFAKLRNPKVGLRCAFFSVFIVCALLYLPLFGGRSLAPTDITILFIPVSWVLMVVGCLVLPWFVSRLVFVQLYQMRFCDRTGHFLRQVARAHLTWEDGKKLIQALRDGHHELIPRFVNSETQTDSNPTVIFTLFGHPQAQVGYIDVDAKFTATIGDATNETTSDWLAYHERLSQDEVKRIAGSIPQRAASQFVKTLQG